MQSRDKNRPVILRFPEPANESGPSSNIGAQPIGKEDLVEVRERCRDTTRALQELRHGIAIALLHLLEKTPFDRALLVQVLDECPSVVSELLAS